MRERDVRKLIVPSFILAMVCALAGTAMAQNYISQVENNDTTGNLIQLTDVPATFPLFQGNGQYPVVNGVLSVVGTTGGHAYTNWAYFVGDSTGGMDVFGHTVGGYTPTVGDTVSINGTYSPFDGFPEMATVTANTLNSQGNSTPTLPNYQGLSTGTYQDPDTQHLGTSMVYSLGTLIAASTNTLTVSAGTVSSTILPIGIGSTILTLENVYVSGGTAFNSFNPTATNQTGTITDLSGGTDGLSMELFYWPTSYSVPLADLGGRALPSTPVNVTGFMDLFSGVPEFVPIDIRNASNNSQLTLVPEPGTLSLLGAGVTVAGAIFIRRRFGRSAKYNLPGSGNGLSFAGSGMNSA